MADVNKTHSYTGVPIPPDAPANPCGLMARSIFNDTFQLFFQNEGVPLDSSNLSYPKDRELKFKRPTDSESTQWIDPMDQHFQVWMRASPFSQVKKLYARIEGPLRPGQYTFRIGNNYPVSQFNG